MVRKIHTLLIAAGLSLAGAGAALAAHTPVFTWQVHGDANYRQGIYDGAVPLAVLDLSTLDEPMQALMFFSGVERPILLRHLRFTPDGPPMVEAVHLFWKCGRVITDVLDGIRVDGSGTDRLAVTFTVRDPWDVIRLERTVTVTWDQSLESYVYDFKDRAVVNHPEMLSTAGPVNIEYCDPWFTSSPAPSQAFPGSWKGRYSMFAYESAAGGVVSIPHNHFSNSQKVGISLKPDGVFAAVYEPDGNPAFQFMGDTAAKTHISICPWGYDVHMGYQADFAALHRPITTHFRCFRLPDAKARGMRQNAAIPALKATEFGGMKEVPVFERVSSFERGISPEKPHEGAIDPWFWVPADETGAVWDQTTARTGSRSLKIEKTTPGVATWHTMSEGQGYFTEPWTPCKGYEISVWVKTKNIAGPGASIGVCYHIPNIPPEWPMTRSERVSGTGDWKKITVRMGPPPEKTSIMSIDLQQAGSGTAWFDDLEVKMLK